MESRRASERTKLLEEGIALKKRLDEKGANLSNKDLEDALRFSKKVDQFSKESPSKRTKILEEGITLNKRIDEEL